MVNFLLYELDNKSDIPNENIIKTGSNLNSTILKELLTTIGIDYSPYELKSNLIDAVLLKNRNMIAHGQYLDIDEDEFYSLYNDIIGIMIEIKNSIINSALLNEYKVTKN
jgi:hypothetical protein